jgi:Tol biopolymer transport system component
MASDGSDLKSVPEPTNVFAGYSEPGAASFAPSGRRFVFDGLRRTKPQKYGIWTQRLDGSRVRRIWSCRSSRCDAYEQPQWSPDGKLLAVGREPQIVRGNFVNRDEIALMRTRDGKIVRRLTIHGEEPDWSPDGRRLVYRTPFEQHERRDGATGGDLFIINRDGTGKRLLLRRKKLAETQPTWSPNGRWIAFVSLFTEGGDVGYRVFPKLWRIRPRGGDPIKIHRLSRVYADDGIPEPQLTWLPDSPTP